MAEFSFAQYQESADYLSARLGGFRPEVLLILGSGLGYLADQVEEPLAVPYGDIPHFARSTAPGHAGRFVFGRLRGRRVAVMQGRFHYYEGYSFPQVTYPVRVLRLLGAETLIVTNAAGCVNLNWSAGTLMVMDDHIKLALDSPLRGENLPQFGPRFPDSGQVYTPALRALAGQVAAEQDIPVEHGVYLFMPGPQYETPAEIRAARLLGADAVGMSTVPEAVVASHAGMQVLGISLLTNMAAGILDAPLSEEEVLTAAAAGRERFSALVLGCLEKMPGGGECCRSDG
ncbi:MAG: purine-nucleoside phosphorylase [Clostridiales bacterium]|nr:purine-nucleoside phosphorylase [Clostridiales bacterium]